LSCFYKAKEIFFSLHFCSLLPIITCAVDKSFRLLKNCFVSGSCCRKITLYGKSEYGVPILLLTPFEVISWQRYEFTEKIDRVLSILAFSIFLLPMASCGTMRIFCIFAS
jgi:hypothetical protein